MDRILRSTIAPIRITVRDSTGALWDSDDEELEAVVRDSAGVEIDTYTAEKESAGTYLFEVPAADTAVLDVYDVEWSGLFDTETQTFHTQFEIVGAFFFTTTEARAFDGSAMADTGVYTNQILVDGREQVESELEDACGVAFVPRGTRVVIDGSASDTLLLPHTRITRVVAVSVGDEALDVSDISLYGNEGRLALDIGTFSAGSLNVSVLYEHGYSQPPVRIKRAALMLLRDRLVGSNIHDRALSHTDDTGTVTLSVAGTNGPFGIPEVDAAVAQYSEVVPQVG